MKKLSFQVPMQEQHAVQTRTLNNQKPVTWGLSKQEAEFLLQSIGSSFLTVVVKKGGTV
ncbi:MAG TPA: hypothetical protein PK978_06865 [Paludibacter sp.]|nr:hypothetical protein [Paludibacter sp.]